MRPSPRPLSRIAHQVLALVWSVLLVAVCFRLVGGAYIASSDDCDPSCSECPAEQSGHECPPGCPDCHGHHSSVASIPPCGAEALLLPDLACSRSGLAPVEATTPRQPFLSTLYRPPRSEATFS